MFGRSIVALAVVASLFLASQAFALGADLPAEQVAQHGPHAVHGYFVNEFDVFFFRADTEAFNEYLAKLAEGRDRKPLVVLREGKLLARSPWSPPGEEKPADWMLKTSADGSFIPVVEVWLGGDIDKAKIDLPKGVRASDAAK